MPQALSLSPAWKSGVRKVRSVRSLWKMWKKRGRTTAGPTGSFTQVDKRPASELSLSSASLCPAFSIFSSAFPHPPHLVDHLASTFSPPTSTCSMASFALIVAR